MNWDDGTKSAVDRKDIIPVLLGKVKVGSRVIAVWAKNSRMYEGLVTASKGETFTVKWDDEAATEVTEPDIRLQIGVTSPTRGQG